VIDLAKTGPFVVDAPAGVLGGIVDFWQWAVIDIGVGATRNGAKLLLLPPGYEGKTPSGYTVVPCKTNRIFLPARGTPKAGEGPEALVKLLGSVGLLSSGAEGLAWRDEGDSCRRRTDELRLAEGRPFLRIPRRRPF
jgi:hypothetical protein